MVRRTKNPVHNQYDLMFVFSMLIVLILIGITLVRLYYDLVSY